MEKSIFDLDVADVMYGNHLCQEYTDFLGLRVYSVDTPETANCGIISKIYVMEDGSVSLEHSFILVASWMIELAGKCRWFKKCLKAALMHEQGHFLARGAMPRIIPEDAGAVHSKWLPKLFEVRADLWACRAGYAKDLLRFHRVFYWFSKIQFWKPNDMGARIEIIKNWMKHHPNDSWR